MATNREELKWTTAHTRIKAGLRLRVSNESTRRYRIYQFPAIEDLPCTAIFTAQGRGHEQISRHATLEEAKAACEQHLRERSHS
jgi:hypothetical protein